MYPVRAFLIKEYSLLLYGIAFIKLEQQLSYLILPFSQQILGNLTQVSYYTMAFSFVVIAKFSFASINDLIFPYLAEKTNKNDFIHFLGKVLLIMGIIALGVIVVSYIIVPFIITFLLG